jgi:hypothetical protein
MLHAEFSSMAATSSYLTTDHGSTFPPGNYSKGVLGLLFSFIITGTKGHSCNSSGTAKAEGIEKGSWEAQALFSVLLLLHCDLHQVSLRGE